MVTDVLEIVRLCVDLGLKIQEHLSTTEANNGARVLLAERIRAINTVLGEIERQHGEATAEGLVQALDCVRSQLDSADGLFNTMRHEGRLRKFWEAKGKSNELNDLDKSLQGAVGVLQIAQTALLGATVNQTKQKVEDVASMLEGLTLDHQHMATETKQLIQVFAEKLTSSASFDLTGRPSIEVAVGWPSPKDFVRYNQQMLQFLKEQLEAFTSIFSKPEFYKCAQEQPEGWAKSMESTMGALKLGWMLIDRHKKPFRLETFYKICEAQTAVNQICSTIKKFMDQWEFEDVAIVEWVPQKAVKTDKNQLCEYLAFVLKDGSCTFDLLPEFAKEEWKEVKVRTETLLDMVKVPTTDGEIVEGKHIAGSVYEATWNGEPVAVKKLLKDNDPSKLELEDFAQFFTEAVALAKLRSDRIVRFKAATESGMLVMERGVEQLLRWCEGQQQDGLVGLAAEGLPQRLGLLLQAGQALHEVHKRKFVHRDVSTGKFVMFVNKGSPPQVKIVGFGLAIVRTETGSQTLRRHIEDTPAWVAPEIFDGKHYDFSSDIYSFGIVLYHVVTGVYPYGRRTPVGELMKKKAEGERPCSLNESLGVHKGLKEVLLKCTERKPEDRYGSMQEVCTALGKVISAAGSNA